MSRHQRDRLLATVMITDIVGSTEAAARLGDHPWRELLRRHDAVLRRLIHRFAGREVNTTGDGFLATFEGPERALRCACAARAGVAALGLELRIGLHAGEVELEGGSVGGIAVHIAARVASLAGGGEVLVSSTVHDLAAGSGYGFEDRGARELKGVPGEWRLYSVTSEPLRLPVRGIASRAYRRLPGSWRARPVAMAVFAAALIFGVTGAYVLLDGGGSNLGPGVVVAESAAPGIAVLPFGVAGADLGLSGEGVMDLLATNLDGAGGLRAIDSRTLLSRWRERVDEDAQPDLRTVLAVARSAGARYALVGNAVAMGGGMRLSADVYDVRTGAKLGRGQADGTAGAVINLVDRLSTDVLRTLLAGDAAALHVDLARVTTDSLEALKAYLEGETLFRRADFGGAVSAYSRAVQEDSTFALAFYRMASAMSFGDRGAAAPHLAHAARLSRRLPEREALLVRAFLPLLRGTLDGLDPAREAVRRYPDDAEAWHLLGDTFFHLGAQALVGPEESDRAFSRATALDPTFTPAYIHLVANALVFYADSARAARLVESYARLAGGEHAARRERLALALGFGSPDVAARALAELDTLQTNQRLDVAIYLTHPRLRAAEERLLSSRPLPAVPAEAAPVLEQLAFNAFARGQARRVLELLDDPLTSAWLRRSGLYSLHLLEMPVAPRILDRGLALGPDEEAPEAGLFYAGAYAADRGRWQDHASAVQRLQGSAERLLAAGDSASAGFFRAAAQALGGYALWRRGDLEPAARALEEAQRGATGWGERGAINATIRFWLGRLHLESGDPARARRFLAPRETAVVNGWFTLEPLAAFHLGRALAQLGNPEGAREAYAFFVLSWGQSDPELQPRVAEARAALARLAPAATAGSRSLDTRATMAVKESRAGRGASREAGRSSHGRRSAT